MDRGSSATDDRLQDDVAGARERVQQQMEQARRDWEQQVGGSDGAGTTDGQVEEDGETEAQAQSDQRDDSEQRDEAAEHEEKQDEEQSEPDEEERSQTAAEDQQDGDSGPESGDEERDEEGEAAGKSQEANRDEPAIPTSVKALIALIGTSQLLGALRLARKRRKKPSASAKAVKGAVVGSAGTGLAYAIQSGAAKRAIQRAMASKTQK
jgi:hypothetical protein